MYDVFYMAEKTFPSVWYTSEKRIKSISKLVVFEDRGRMDIDAKSMRFLGNKTTIDMEISRIQNITLVRQSIPWTTYIILNLILLPILACGAGILPAIVLLFFSNVIGLLIGWSTRWVLVEYQDVKGNLAKAYFADGSLFGWGGLFGGTKKLYKSLIPIHTSQ